MEDPDGAVVHSDTHRKMFGHSDTHRKMFGHSDTHRKMFGHSDTHRKKFGHSVTYRRMFGWLSLFISCTSFSMLERLDGRRFIFSTIT